MSQRLAWARRGWRSPRGVVVTAAGATMVSQSLSAGSNFIIAVAIGRYAGARSVGQFELVIIIYTAALGLQRSSVTDPLLARAPGATGTVRAEQSQAVTASLVLSGVGAIVVLVAGLASPYHQLALFAPFLPFVLLEDLCRYLCFRHSRHAVAALLDLTWAACSCVAFFAIRAHPSTDTAVLLWGTGGAVAAVVGLVLVRCGVARLRTAGTWWRHNLWQSSRWLSLESAFYQADQQIQAFGVTAVAGAALFGEWEVAQSLVGLSAFFNAGIAIVTMNRLTRADGRDEKDAVLSSALQIACVVIVTVALVGFAPAVMHLLFGNRISVPTRIILPTGVLYAGLAATSGPISLLRVRRSEKILPIARSIGPLLVSPLAILVARWSFPDALWVLAAQPVLYLIVVGWTARRGETRPRQESPAGPLAVSKAPVPSRAGSSDDEPK